MTELRPLLESSDDELERALLRSVCSDLPGPAGLREAALALGLATSTANTLAATVPTTTSLGSAMGVPGAALGGPLSASGGAVTGTGTVVSTAGASATLGLASFGVLGKGLLGGALVSFMALTALEQTRAGSDAAVPVVQKPSSAARVALPAEEQRTPSAFVAPSSEPVVSLPETAQVTTAPPGNPRSRAATLGRAAVAQAGPSIVAPAASAFAPEPLQPPVASAMAANASLAAEIRALDQARAALARGDTNRATQLLDAYAANRPSPTLSQEAALLRVRLLLSRGQRSAAARLARRIIAQYPESTHVESLRRLANEP